MPTTLLQVPRKTFGAFAGTPASLPAFALAFAGTPAGLAAFSETFAQVAQVPQHLPRRLRKPRKSRGICRSVCAGCASLEVFAETFAQVAQVPRHLPRHLRRPRKSRGICRSVCAGRASSKIFVGACLFVDNGRPIYGSPCANLLMACSMSPPRRSASRMTSTFSVSSVVYARYSSRETSVA